MNPTPFDYPEYSPSTTPVPAPPPAAPPPVGAAAGFQAPYAATLGQQMVDGQLPASYQPYWFESQQHYQATPLFKADAARQMSTFLNTQPQTSAPSTGGGAFSDFPTRISLPFPWTSSPGEPPDLGAVGVGLGIQPGQSYGGVVPGTGIANTPITLANFSAWGRERTLALIDSIFSGGNYITPQNGQFGQDNTGPENKSPLDNFIDAIKTPFNAIGDVFNGIVGWYRDDQALHRGLQVRDLAQTGTVQMSDRGLIDAITSAVTGANDKFSADAIYGQAQQKGVDYVSAVASLYDLDPQIVAAIMANPYASDDEIKQITSGQPFSRNPVVNMSLEFAAQATLFVGTAVATAGLGDIAAGAGAAASAARAAGAASAASRAIQFGATAGRTALQINSINTAAGWTIGGAEWGIKQAAVLAGNQQVVDLMDRLMWNMPLSMNPGVNIVTAFSSHPLEALGIGKPTGLLKGSVEIGKPGTLGYFGRFEPFGRTAEGERVFPGTLTRPPKIIDLPGANARYPVVMVGDQLVRLNKDGSLIYHAIQNIDSVDGFQPLFDRIGWDRDRVQAAFGPGNPDGLVLDDLKEAILYTSMSAVRSEKGPLASLTGISEVKVVDRALKFMADNIGDAHRLFADSLNGSSDALVNEFKGQWWRFADLNDTLQAQTKARLTQEFDPNLSFVDFLSWVKVSKIHREALLAGLVGQDTAIRLRTTVNRPYVEQFRDSIIKRYDAGSIVPSREIDLLKRLGGRIEERGRGSELVKGPYKPTSRARLVDILDSVLEDDARIRGEEAGLARDPAAVVAPGRDIADPIEEARVLHVGVQDIELIRKAEGLPPEQLIGVAIPRNVLREVAKWARTSEDALMADPAKGWQKVFDWLHTTEEQAVETAAQRDAIDSFTNVLNEQRGIDEPFMDEAIRGAQWTKDYLLTPVQRSYLKAGDPLLTRLDTTQRALEQVWPVIRKLADDPIRKVPVLDFAEGRFAWPAALPRDWADGLLKLIREAGGKVNEGDLATLTDPVIHPLLKIDVLERADLTDAQRKVLEPFLTTENRNALATTIEDVFGPGTEADAANALRLVEKYDQWQNKIVDAGANLAAIGARYRAIETGGGHTPEVLDLYDRFTDYSAKANTPWRSISVKSYDRPVPTTEQRVEGVRRQEYDRRVRATQAELEQAQRELDTLEQSAIAPDFENPVRTYPVRKGGVNAANAKARQVSRETGLPTMVRPVRKPSGAISHYEVVVGTVKPREEVAAVTDALGVAPAEPTAAEPIVEAPTAPETALPATEPAPVVETPAPAITPEQEAALAQLDLEESLPPVAPAGEPLYGNTTDFPIPGDETTRVPATYRLMDLSELRVSGDKGYRAELQPRNRQRVTSDAQIADIANRFDPNLALRSESGSHGPQVIDPAGNVLAGNGRAKAMRQMTDAQYAKYADALAQRAGEFGLTEEQVRALDRPILVREVPAEQATAKLAVDLNAETGRMTTVEQARVLADAITPDQLEALELGKQSSVQAALQTQRNKGFVESVLSLLNKQQVDSLLDEHGNLNADGATLISKAILQKVLRDPTGELLSRIINGGEFLNLRNGIEDASGQLAKAQAAFEQGRLSESIADTLRNAMSEYESYVIERRRLGTNERPVSMMSFSDPLASDLAWSLSAMSSRVEIARFFREYADAMLGRAIDNVDAGPGLFGMEAAPQADALRKSIQDAIRVVNNERRLKSGKPGLFDASEPVKPVAEVPQLPDADGTIPAPFENAAGVQAMARDVPVINEADGINARIAPANVLHVKGNPLDPATYAGADKAAEVVFHGGPENYARTVQAFYDNSEAAVRAYNEFARNPSGDTSTLFRQMSEAVNNGEAGGAELMILNDLSSDGLRFDTNGFFNGTFDLSATLEPGKYDQFAGIGRGETPMSATHEPITAQPGDAAVFSRQPEGTPPGAGITADQTIEQADVVNAIDGGAQTFVKRGGVNDTTARNRTGASKGNPASVVLEVNPPDEATLLRLAQERVDALRQRIAENEAQRDALAETPEHPQTEAPLDPQTESLLFDYINEPMDAAVKEFYGSDRLPTNLGQIMDVIESIDANIPPLGRTMTDGEMQALRAGLMDWLDRRLALEPGMPNKTQLKEATKTAEDRLKLTVLDTPDKFADGLVTAMRALEPIVKEDPHGPPSAHWEGTQYDLGYLPHKDAQGRVLPPRILSNTSLMDMLAKVAPDLPDELMMGRKQAFGARINTARLSGFMRSVPGAETIDRAIRFGERMAGTTPERDLRYAMLNRYADELVGPPPEGDLSALAAWQADRKQAMGIVGALHKEMSRPENTALRRFRKFRTEYELGSERFDRIVKEYLAGADAKVDDLPGWAKSYIATHPDSPSPFFDAWAQADNRLRTWFSEQPNGAARYVVSLYDSPRARAISRNRAGLVQIYHQYRFLLDARWLALEMIEAPTLTLFREGPGALMEALGWKVDGLKVTRKSGAELSKPLFLGLDDLSRQRADFAWWTASTNPGLNLRYRENYINGLVKHGQISDFPDVLRDMAMRDPEIAQTMRALGDTPKDWLERLNNSWELYSALSRKLNPDEAAAVYGPRLKDGTINQVEYDKLLKAAAKDGYHYVSIPAFEQEIAAAAGNPILAPVMQRMKFLTEQAWNDAAQLIYGQVDRSNIQRLLNHPLLYWPLSYQIKAAKWLAGLLFDRFMGVDTGSLGALTLDRIHQMHQQQYQQDADYRQFFEDNKTLLFVASMLFPVTPFDIGVGLSPFTRLAVGTATGALGLDDPLDPEGSQYRRNIFAIGPGYTYYSLFPRLGYEMGKSPNPIVSGVGQGINRFFPYQITVGPKSSSQQTQQTQPAGYDQAQPPAIFPTPPQRYTDNTP